MAWYPRDADSKLSLNSLALLVATNLNGHTWMAFEMDMSGARMGAYRPLSGTEDMDLTSLSERVEALHEGMHRASTSCIQAVFGIANRPSRAVHGRHGKSKGCTHNRHPSAWRFVNVMLNRGTAKLSQHVPSGPTK